ncbi:hypothetical protein M7963_08080 [Enterobacter roggenkampii]|uniref:hypothetical protein n=1 Tax=Enterobacter roggenkampii TaxID=1812935 RepID=UPI002238D1D2|nr:hypothetical protein [Enterobacter roggenkampii]MCW5001475.1 hypothetical protein [Enterobacter roggenkampii]
MKKILAALIFITTTTEAAVLQCEQLKARGMRSTYSLPDGQSSSLLVDIKPTGSALGSPKFKNFHITLDFPDSLTSTVLAGNYIRIHHSFSGGDAYSYSTTPIPAGVNTFSVTIPCNESVSGKCDIKNSTTNIVLSSEYYSSKVANIDTNITMPLSENIINVSALITSNNIQVSDMKPTATRILNAVSQVEDSITIPDTVDLGLLSIGQNNNPGAPITYIKNKNNIPIQIEKRSITQSTNLTVNNEIVNTTTLFTPPLILGLNLLPSSQPGEKSATVGVSWTCP